jgi:pimeloyl-ACP methyl ester carboxylesterase
LTKHLHDDPSLAFEQAERRLFAACAVKVEARRVGLADPPVAVRVIEADDGPPLVFVHGSGLSASTWAPLMPHLERYRLIAFDLPGFGSVAPSITAVGRCAHTQSPSSPRYSMRSSSNVY